MAEPPGPYTPTQFTDRHDLKALVSHVGSGSGMQVWEVGFGLAPVQGDGEEEHVRVCVPVEEHSLQEPHVHVQSGAGGVHVCDSAGLPVVVPQLLVSVHVRVCMPEVGQGLGENAVQLQFGIHAGVQP